jgi:hypothetical protein
LLLPALEVPLGELVRVAEQPLDHRGRLQAGKGRARRAPAPPLAGLAALDPIGGNAASIAVWMSDQLLL